LWRKELFLLSSLILILSFVLYCLPPRFLPKTDKEAFQKAQRLYHQGKRDEALMAFKSFAAKYPRSAYLSESLLYLGIIYNQKQEPKKALAYFDESLLYNPPVHLQVRISQQSGISYSYLKDYQTAIKHFRKALYISSRPDEKRDISLLLAWSYQNMGNSARALKEYFNVLAYDPDVQKETKVKEGLIKLILEIKNEDELVPLKEEKILTGEIRGYVYYRLAELYFATHDYEAGYKISKEYNRLFPSHPYHEKTIALIRQTEELMRSVSQANKYRIGCILPLSGKYASIGQKILNGIKLAFLILPIQEGKEGPQLIVKDSGSIPEKAISSLEDLAAQDKVLVIIGPLTNEVLENVNSIAAKHHIALISPSTADRDLAQKNPYIFRTIPNIRQWGEQMARFAMQKLNLTTFAILHPYTPYGTQLQESFRERVVQLGGNISKMISYGTAGSDLGPMLEDLVDQEDKGMPPQALFLPEEYYGLRLIAPQLAYYFGNRILLLSCCHKEPPPLGDIARSGLEGAIFMTEFFPSSADPKIKIFVDGFKRTFGIEPDYWAAQGYDAAYIIFHILQQRKVLERKSFRDFILGIKDFLGVTGKISVLSDGTVEKLPFILQIKEGQFLQLD
jgi:ABC-type branched-subunit amino acid transport system substrate-binding protein